MERETTPRPWVAGVEAEGWHSAEHWRVPIGPGKIAAAHLEADAALIVEAVNNYDRLRAIEAAARAVVAGPPRLREWSSITALREALQVQENRHG